MAINDVYRVTVTATGQQSLYQNSYAMRVKTSNPITDVNFGALVTDLCGLFKNRQHTTITYVSWTALQLWGSGMSIVQSECRRDGGQAFAGTITSQVGTVSGDMLPPQSACVVTLTTGLAGRRRRGRLYAVGLVEADQNEGLWVAGVLSGLKTNFDTFYGKYKQDGGTDTTFEWGIWSERIASGCVPANPPNKGHVNVDTPTPDLAWRAITGYTVRPVVYSQRRRTRGVGF